MKRIVTWGLPLIGCLALLSLFIFRRPAFPKEWNSVHAGMQRADVVATISDPIIDMRELKGFDVVTRWYSMFGIRPCYWQLELTYDTQGRVKDARRRFIDPNCGLLNSQWEKTP